MTSEVPRCARAGPLVRQKERPLSGTVIGYDPGGNARHGLAELLVTKAGIVGVATSTHETTESVVDQVLGIKDLIGFGVDTLTRWSTGPSGWRPADRWLIENYPKVVKSVVNPNALRGSMALSGMAVLMHTRERWPKLVVTETHPKVLFHALRKKRSKYNYKSAGATMTKWLGRTCGVVMTCANDHEWDAAISAYAVVQGLTGAWARDLHTLPQLEDERAVEPCGATHYWWPE